MLLFECLLGLIRFLLGAALFSFMNVVAWRLPRNMDPLKGRSICPRCGRTLDAPDLVPVFSWLFLREFGNNIKSECVIKNDCATAAHLFRHGICWWKFWAARWRWGVPGSTARPLVCPTDCSA